MDITNLLANFDFAFGRIEDFISGEVVYNPVFFPPATPLPKQLDEHGRRFIKFNQLGRSRLLQSFNEMLDEMNITSSELFLMQIALRDIAAFVQDVEIYYTPGSGELEPSVRYILWNPEHVLFYPKPNDPRYKEYSSKLARLKNTRDAGLDVSEEFIGQLREEERLLFYGADNVQMRADAMNQAVKNHLGSKSGLVAMLLVLYSRAELSDLLEKAEREATKKVKSKKPKPVQNKNEQYLKSGHLVDQQLKYVYPPEKKGQLNLFDSLMPVTKSKITESGFEFSSVVEGIKLTPTETKIVDALCKLLHQQSQTKDKLADDYYKGPEREMVLYGGAAEASPKLTFSLYELTKEYKGGDNINGKDAINVKAALEGLATKLFLIRYTMRAKKPGGGEIKREIEEPAHLIKIYTITDTETDEAGVEVYRKIRIAVGLSPIFAHQINSKFIVCPADLTRRTIIAYGSPNISDATLRLSEYLRRALSDKKQSKVEIKQDRLYYLLCEKMMNEGRRSKVKEFTDKAIQTVKNLNLVTKCEIVAAKTDNEPKIIFHLNKSWK